MPTQTQASRTLWVRNQYDTKALELLVTDAAGQPLDLDGTAVTIDIAHRTGDHHYAPYWRIVEQAPCETAEGVITWKPEPDDLTVVGSFHVKFTIWWDETDREVIPADYPLALKVNPRIGGP